MQGRSEGPDGRGAAPSSTTAPAPWVPGSGDRPPWDDVALSALVRRPGRRERPALVLEGSVRTYGSLADGAGRLGGALAHRYGVQAGDRVALSAKNCLGYLEAEIAIAEAAAVMVAMSWRYTDAERVDVLRRSGARVLLCDADMVSGVEAARRRGELPELHHVLRLCDAQDGGHDDEEPLDARVPTPRAGHLADPHEIIYTSGTTGEPKGAVWTQGAVIWNSIQQAMDFGLGPTSSTYVAFDLNYIGGRHQFTWALLHQGGTVHLRRSGGFDAEEVLRYLSEKRITHVLWVPTMLYDILSVPTLPQFDLGHLEMIMCGGAPLSEAVIRQAQAAFPHTRVVQVYGLTEGGGTVTYVPPDDVHRKVGSAGLPSMHNMLRVVDSAGSPCAPGTTGEILVRGPAMTTGYWDDPEATAAAVRDGWLWTGDLGHLDAEGFLYIDGRRKELIISGGMNIFPKEIEDVLRSHAGVRDAAVIGVPHERWGETVCAVVERVPGGTVDSQELIAHCRERLASYKKPTVVRFLPTLPRTLSGKVRKTELAAFVRNDSTG